MKVLIEKTASSLDDATLKMLFVSVQQNNLLVLPQRTTICWIAAEHALQHARNNMSSVSKVFDRWQIQKSEYVIHAGFDESLIKSGFGYLEQIHIFVFTKVDATSPLLSELGRLFSPFSSILFSESSTYCLPVFKDDGSIWEFDKLIDFTASKFEDGGSSAKTPLTVISLSQTDSLIDGTTGFSGNGEGEKNRKQRLEKGEDGGFSAKTPLAVTSLSQTDSLVDGTTGFSQSNSGNKEEEKNRKQKLGKGKERDTGDKDEADKDDKDPSDHPSDPPGDGDGIIAEQPGPAKISFEIASEIHPIQDEQNDSQTLTMHGSLTIKVILYCYCNVVLPN